MHKFKFRFGDRILWKGRKAVYVKRRSNSDCYIARPRVMFTIVVSNWDITPDYAGAFTLRKARGGFRYNVQGLNGEVITTSEVLVQKQSATEMHERHYRAYRLIDKTVGK